MEQLTDIDKKIFFFINQRIHNSFFDFILVPMRNPQFWIPLYVALIAFFIWRFRKHSWAVLLFAGITVLLTDQISSTIIKPMVHRLRPCHNPDIESQVRALVGCGSGFSFVSAHATNHFGIAVFIIMLVGKQYRWIAPLALLWAFIISFAQVYVGLHYPADVTAGAIIGVLIGYITGRVCRLLLIQKLRIQNYA